MSMNLNIRSTDPRYRELVQAVNARVKRAEDGFRRSRYAAWRKAEETHTAYVKETEKDAEGRADRDSGTPRPLTVMIPESYAELMSAHTYWTSVFLGRTPIHQFTGRNSIAEDASLRLESVIEYQTTVGRHLPPLYVWLLDIGRYGLGAMSIHWADEHKTFSQIIRREVPNDIGGIILDGDVRSETVRQTFRQPSYSGARLQNIWPFDLRLDPDVPLKDFQEGEFVGRRYRFSHAELIEGEASGRFLKGSEEALERHLQQKMQSGEESRVVELPNEVASHATEGKIKGSIYGEQMAIRLVPSAWKLGSSKYPEIWLLNVVDGNILIEAKPQAEAHCQFPFIVAGMEVEGYHLPARGMYEVLEPYQNMLDWFLNTHFFAARKNINGITVADPSRIHLKDLYEPDGAIVRAKSAAMGRPLSDAIYQVPFNDPTIQHVADGQRMMDQMQRIFGVSNNMMGALGQSGRRTATEVRQTNTLGASRLKTVSEWFSAVGFSPLASLIVQLTQQHMTEAMEVRIAGSMHGVSTQHVLVSPEDILGQFDFVPADGNLPIDKLALAGLWTQLFQQMAQMPEVLQAYDVPKIFGFVAQLSGLKNLDQFRRQGPIQTQIVPDDQAEIQADRGNVIPLSSFAGERSAQQPIPGFGPLQ